VKGSLRQRGLGSWQLRVHAGRDDVSGKPIYVAETVRGDRDAAERRLAALVAQVTDSPTSPTLGTVGELCHKWWTYSSPNLSPTVAREYRRIIDQRLIPTIGHLKLSDLRANQLDAWYQQLLTDGAVTGQPLSANSVRRIHAVLHRALEQGIAWDWIGHNPARRATPPPAHRSRPHLPTAEEVNELIVASAVVNPHLPVFFRLAAVSGARRGELCALQWKHIDLYRRTLHIAGQIAHTADGPVQRPTKTHAERRLTLDETTVGQLADIRPVDAPGGRFVFSHHPEGTPPWQPDYATRAFVRVAAQLGIPGIRLHDLRHFAATTMLLNGIDVRTAAGRLGHARASTTLDIYAHFTQPADQHASATLADSLDAPTRANR
jgi:integrase